MLNYPLKQIPERPVKPREKGITMVMDKGLSLGEAKNLLEVAIDHIDIIKLGWATSAVTSNLEKKLAFYREAGVPYYFGGTLFEAFYVRGQVDDYRRTLEKYKARHMEVSDGSIELSIKDKRAMISSFAKEYTVLSEVGSKNPDVILKPSQWIEMIQGELDAGSWKVIAEARESGTVGMFNPDGNVRNDLINVILDTIPAEKILWEAPLKSQQVWFIKLLGTNVNLGNIAPVDVIPLETLRLGLRGDTFDTFLGK
jgi:phosphosulfolactate synthase